MRLRVLLSLLAILGLSGQRARADIPTLDSAQLDQHTNIANTKLKLLPVVTNHASAD